VTRAAAGLLALLVLATSAVPVASAEPVTGAVASPDTAEPPRTELAGQAIPGEVVVGWHDATRGPAAVRTHAVTLLRELGTPGQVAAASLVSTGTRPVDQVLAALRADPAVAYAEPNYRVELAFDGPASAVSVSDPLTGGQYSLNRMRVRDAWAVQTGARNVVAVLDTGVQFSHPDLVGRLATGWDFVNNRKNASDDNGHGTWVSGIIAANANDGYGIAGISWSDYVLPIKIMDREGRGTTANLIAGIRYAADRGASVINMSVGGFPYTQGVQDAVNYAWNKGAVLVGAAGNNRREETFYPASFANVVSVSATQVDDEFSHWSSYGPKVDLSAPGSSVLTTNCYTCTYAGHDTWGHHTYISGTSFATPNVAGVVALLRAMYPTATPQQIVDRLLAGVDDLGYPGWDNRYGRGRVNALSSLAGTPAGGAAAASGDSFEPNNLLAAAGLVAIGTTVSPSIHPAGDVDTFAFDAPRMGRLEVRVTGVVDTRAYPWNKSSLQVDPIVELYSSAGGLLKRVDGASESGTELASISVSGPTRILVRVTNKYANGNPKTYTVSTAFVDEVPPKLLGLRPAPGSVMVSPLTGITFGFSEPVSGVDSSSVHLRTAAGTAIPASVSYSRATGRVVVDPLGVLPADTTIRLSVAGSIKDDAGLALRATTYAFSTMPGQSWSPGHRITFSAGVHTGHRIGSAGSILGLLPGRLASASGASVTQRARLPNLPGAWLYVANGMWAGTWMREGSTQWTLGTTELTSLPSTTRLSFAAGTHVGRTFDSAGKVTSTRSGTLSRQSGANVDAVAVINGVRRYRVVNGMWAGFWIAESASAYRVGIVDRMPFSPSRRVQIRAGTHTGVAVTAQGTVVGTRRATLARTSGAPVSAWAVVNGRAHVLIMSGMWAGYWIPEEVVLAYER
jgi:subtilisin family serine protease